MDDSDKEAFGAAIGAMLVTFGQEATKPRLMGYWLGLKDLSLEKVEEAVAVSMRTAKRLPMPAELRELATGGNANTKAIRAWEDIQLAMPHGAYKSVAFEDVLINAAIRQLGGWPALFERCATTDGEKWYRIEFMKLYETYSSAGVSGESCRPLAGLSLATVVKGELAPVLPLTIHCDPERSSHSRELIRYLTRTAEKAPRLVPAIELKKP